MDLEVRLLTEWLGLAAPDIFNGEVGDKDVFTNIGIIKTGFSCCY